MALIPAGIPAVLKMKIKLYITNIGRCYYIKLIYCRLTIAVCPGLSVSWGAESSLLKLRLFQVNRVALVVYLKQSYLVKNIREDLEKSQKAIYPKYGQRLTLLGGGDGLVGSYNLPFLLYIK